MDASGTVIGMGNIDAFKGDYGWGDWEDIGVLEGEEDGVEFGYLREESMEGYVTTQQGAVEPGHPVLLVGMTGSRRWQNSSVTALTYEEMAPHVDYQA